MSGGSGCCGTVDGFVPEGCDIGGVVWARALKLNTAENTIATNMDFISFASL